MKLGQFLPLNKPQEPVVSTMETIAFQKNHPGGPLMEALVMKYMDLVKSGASAAAIEADKDLRNEFRAIMKDHFGIDAVLHTNSILAATMPNTYIKHSALVRRALREYFSKDSASGGQNAISGLPESFNIGRVDTEKAKIYGWLSEQSVPIFINFRELSKIRDFSPAELTAIILHEVGHVFSGAAMAIRVNTTNQIVADVVKHVMDKKMYSDKEYIFKELSKLDGKLDKDTVDGLMSGNATVVGVSAFRLIQGTISSLSGSVAYDDTSYEALSDSFATRMGYGAPLSTGLAKMMLISSPISTLAEYYYAASTIGIVTSLIKLAGVALSGKLTFKIAAGILLVSFNLYRILSSQRISSADYEYDQNRDRLSRIRRNVIEQLKVPELDVKTKRAILEQIETVDEAMFIIANVPKVTQMALALVFKKDFNTFRSIAAQQEIEKMLANDIFVSASRLSVKG